MTPSPDHYDEEDPAAMATPDPPDPSPPPKEHTTMPNNGTPAPHPSNQPAKAVILAGQAPLAAVDSPSSTDRYNVVLRDEARGLQLMQSLIVVEIEGLAADGTPVRQQVLGQIRGIELRNQHHEIPLFQAQLRRKGFVPGLSGRADHVTAHVHPVDAVQLGADGRVVSKVAAGTAIPPTGTDVIIADDAAVARFIPAGTPGLLRIGYLVGKTHLPIRVPHFARGTDGAGEALHVGIFGKSGSGKTVKTAELIAGRARHRQMGQLILDHDGDLSSLRIGDDGTGRPHFDLARALVAAGRDLQRDVRVIEHDDLRLEAPRDLASALRHHKFIRQLGVGPGEKENACAEKLYEILRERLGDNGRFDTLAYDDVIDEICEAFAQTYASGQSGNARARKQQEFTDRAHDGAVGERLLRRAWIAVQAYASRPHAIADVVEAALFDGQVVFVRRTDADGTFDDMVLKRVVRTMLDIAKVTYLLSKGAGASGGELFGRYGYLRSRFDKYRRAQVNCVCVLDEAHTVAGEQEAREEDTVASEIAFAIRHTRKYHLGFLVATQEIGALSQRVFRGLHTYIFGFGLKNASEQERVKEILSDSSAWKMYEQMPDPKSSAIYEYAVQGAALPLANGAAVTVRAYAGLAEFLAANAALGLTDPATSSCPPPAPASAAPRRGWRAWRAGADERAARPPNRTARTGMAAAAPRGVPRVGRGGARRRSPGLRPRPRRPGQRAAGVHARRARR
jgi:DNA helicase HerA-like ATPase